jgi:cytidylate kinase
MNFKQALDILNTTKPLRITVSGQIGAGKSTFAKRLSNELNIPRLYVGQFMREEAQKRGLTLDEFNSLLENDDSIDRQMDEMQKQKSLEVERGIFEGRTAWYFVQNPDVRVFFAVDSRVAAERIWHDNNDLRDKYASIDELLQANEARVASETARYMGYYGIDAYKLSNFDVIVDTSNIGTNEVFEQAVVKIAEYLQENIDKK